MQQPETATVGRIVHYVSDRRTQGEYDPECQAAIVTNIRAPGLLNLTVFTPYGLVLAIADYHDPQSFTHGSWHWPERAPIS